MYKRVIIIFSLLFIFSWGLFSTNVSMKYKKNENSFDLTIYDNINKFNIKLKDNKIDSVDISNFQVNSLIIKKEAKFINREIYVDNSINYYINIINDNLEFFTNYSSFDVSNNKINSLVYSYKKLRLEFVNYSIKNVDNNSFYYDFSNLNFTNNGFINYIDYSFYNFDIKQEVAYSKFGLLYSSFISYKFKKLLFFLVRKNMNEKYIYGIEFKDKIVNFKISDKIYPISIYGGQGVKRNFTIDSKLCFNYKFKTMENKLIVKIHHEIDYNKYLEREYINHYSVSNVYQYKKNTVHLFFEYNKLCEFYIKINNLKLLVKNKEIILEISYNIKKENVNYNINLTSNGLFEFSSIISL